LKAKRGISVSLTDTQYSSMNIITTILAWALTVFAVSAQNTSFETTAHDAPAQFAAILVHVSGANGQYAIKLNGAFLKAGVYKEGLAPEDAGQAGDLLCMVLNRDMKTLDSLLIKNPLRVRMEFPADNGVIGSTMVEYPDQEVLIRFNYAVDMKYVQFRQFGTDMKLTEIATLPLVFE